MAAGDSYDTTNLANMIPELWAEPIYKFFFANMQLRGAVDDYSAMVKGQGDTIHIPKIARKAAVTKTGSTALSFTGDSLEGKVDLDISTHKAVPMLFDDMALIQANSELLSKYAKMAGESLAREVEDSIWAELDGFQTTVDVHSSSDNVFGADTLESVLSSLYGQDINPNTCSIVLNNECLADFMNPSSGVASYFIRKDAGGSGAELRSGAVGLIYGMNVFYGRSISSSGTDGTVVGAVFPPEACAFAASQDVRIQSEYDVAYLGTKVVADIIYGTKLIDESGHTMGLNLTNP